MAEPVDFNGRNILLRGNPAQGVRDMHAYRDDATQTWWSVWELTPDELDRVKRTGQVWIGVLSAGPPQPVMCSGHPMAPAALEPHESTIDAAGNPTRISAQPNDPGFINYIQLMAAGKSPAIKVDGVIMADVITADTVEGFVLVYSRDETGEIQVIHMPNADGPGSDAKPVHKRIEGKVTFEFPLTDGGTA